MLDPDGKPGVAVAAGGSSGGGGAGGAGEPALVIVLIGKLGRGKSSTANMMLGARRFASRRTAAAVTIACQTGATVTAAGRPVIVLDSPGLGDPSTTVEDLHAEMRRGFDAVVKQYPRAGTCPCHLRSRRWGLHARCRVLACR